MEIEEIETFQQQALEITPIDDNFDPSKQPQNGEEYLRHMLYERKKCPLVVVKRPKKLELNSTTESLPLELQPSCTDTAPDENLLPTIEWKNIQSCNFIRTRSKIMMLRQHLANCNYDNSLEPPMITDELEWLKFCQQHQPLLSLILRFNQRYLEQLLLMLSDWLKGDRGDETETGDLLAASSSSTSAAPSSVAVLDLACSDRWLGDWFYAVLACLHSPLEPSVHSTLRDIARTCMQYRSRLKSHEFEKVTCPGVWVCSHGILEVTIKVLGYFFRTGAMEPYFPLLCHDQFVIEGYFKSIQTMASLIDNFSKERLEITLWQNSRRMAYYEGVLMDLLHHQEQKLQCRHINTRQLLMKATPAFPGIIAPQLELTSHLFIKDTILNLYNTSEDFRKYLKRPRDNFKLLKNPKSIQYQKPCTIQTAGPENTMKAGIRINKQKAVCHARNTKQITKTPTNESSYSVPHKRRVSLASCSNSNNTHTLEGICDIDHDNHETKIYDPGHDKFCELCRLYKEVFLM